MVKSRPDKASVEPQTYKYKTWLRANLYATLNSLKAEVFEIKIFYDAVKL